MNYNNLKNYNINYNSYLEIKINNLLQKLNNLDNKVENIEKKIDNILEILNYDIKKNTDKMKDHIDFIEIIYNNIKSPLAFFCSKINLISQNNSNYSLH